MAYSHQRGYQYARRKLVVMSTVWFVGNGATTILPPLQVMILEGEVHKDSSIANYDTIISSCTQWVVQALEYIVLYRSILAPGLVLGARYMHMSVHYNLVVLFNLYVYRSSGISHHIEQESDDKFCLVVDCSESSTSHILRCDPSLCFDCNTHTVIKNSSFTCGKGPCNCIT